MDDQTKWATAPPDIQQINTTTLSYTSQPQQYYYPQQPQQPQQQYCPQNPNPHGPQASQQYQYYYPTTTSDAYSQQYIPQQSFDHHPSSSGYYSDPNSVNWAVHNNDVVQRHYVAVDPNAAAGYSAAGVTVPLPGTGELAAANLNSSVWHNPSCLPQKQWTWKKPKTKIVQSAYCEICKVDCNSQEVFEAHKLGKKHKKNLEKLNQATMPAPSAPAESSNPTIGPQEKPEENKAGEAKKSKRKKAQETEDLETKKRKVVEGGADAAAIRTCTICNVVCNSETVFNYHLAGQKHAAMMKKQAAGGVATAS